MINNDIRIEKAKALVNYIEEVNSRGADSTAGWDKNCKPYKELKASLRPSREEVADYLDEANKAVTKYSYTYRYDDFDKCFYLRKYINYAIEILRESHEE